jgi:TRAP-type C4-dicarboxylate transport system substrate-binding protein
MTFFKTVLALILASAPAHAARIKFATLAPDGTDAMKVMREIDKELQAKTAGKVKFKFYAGGRQGDEKDMVRKIRVGQLHAGGFTGVGLGEIAPEIRVLDAPWLFNSHEEVDHIYDEFAKDFETAFDKKGYVLLGWTEVGFVHVFSNAPVRKAADMKKLKIWVWEGDPIAEAAFGAIGVHPVPLSITDVNSSLQTGLINAVYSAPLYAIALQWHEKTKHVYSLPLANASGAVLIAKKRFNKLKPEERTLLKEISAKHLRTLNEKSRRENEKAVATLKKQGLKWNAPDSPKARQAFIAAGKKARRELIGRLYSKELLDRIEESLAAFRKNAKKSGAKKKTGS